MPRIITHGSIGKLQPLQVRSGHTLTPQTVVLKLRSGQTLDPSGSALVLRLYARAGARVPLIDPSFDPPVRLSDDSLGRPRFRISQSREMLEAALAAAGPPPLTVAGKALDQRVLWWTCSYRDTQQQLFPVFYGEFTVALGAAGV